MAKKTPSGGKRRKPKPTKPLPHCRAILICEKVVKDAFDGTTTLVGILTRFGVTTFPGPTPQFYIFVQLAHGMVGEYKLSVEIQDDREGTVIGQSSPIPLIFTYRMEVRDIILRLPPVKLPHAGSYTVAIFANGNEIGRQTFDTPPEGSEDASGSPRANE